MTKLTRFVAILSCILLSSCGYVPTAQNPGDQVASSARSPSPSPRPTPTSTNPKLALNDCVAAPLGTRTDPMANDLVTFQVPTGWTNTTSSAGPSETRLIQLTAPATYGSDDVTTEVHSLLYRGAGVTAHQILSIDAAGWTNLNSSDPWTPLAPISDCAVAGENASFEGFSHDGLIEYRIYFIHQPSALPYGIFIAGHRGIDDQSMLDAKRLMGSWEWGKWSSPVSVDGF